MPVHRTKHTRNFTVMGNEHLRDKALTLKAKGLMSMMLSFPEEWNYSVMGLAAICKEGPAAVRSALEELEGAGYLTRRTVRGPGGRITDTEYTIHEAPEPEEEPAAEGPPSEKPRTEKPHTEKPHAENRRELNKDISTTEKSNTDTTRTHSFSPRAPREGTDRGADGSERREEIKERVEYEVLCAMYGPRAVDELIELMVEVDMNRSPTVRLGRDAAYPTDYVRRRLGLLGREHVEKVLDGIRENTTYVKNTRAYLLAALFNAAATLDSHYTMRVNHDACGEG